jgi:hypothetical protein
MASTEAWRTMSMHMGLENMGGPAVGFLTALPTPTVTYGAVMTHDDRTGEMTGFRYGEATGGAHSGHDMPGMTRGADSAASHTAHGARAGADSARDTTAARATPETAKARAAAPSNPRANAPAKARPARRPAATKAPTKPRPATDPHAGHDMPPPTRP